jgi:hypothetical protein
MKRKTRTAALRRRLSVRDPRRKSAWSKSIAVALAAMRHEGNREEAQDHHCPNGRVGDGASRRACNFRRAGVMQGPLSWRPASRNEGSSWRLAIALSLDERALADAVVVRIEITTASFLCSLIVNTGERPAWRRILGFGAARCEKHGCAYD